MRYEEHVSSPRIDMCRIDIDTTMFQMQIGIYVDYRIFTDLHAWIVGILNSKLSNSTEIIRSIIAGKETYITA